MFKKMIVPALVLAATSAAAIPAAAQSYDARAYHGPSYSDHRGSDRADYRGWQSINERQDRLDRRIDRAVRDGSMSRREAFRLRDDLDRLARLEANYRRGGLSGWERADLDRRFDRLSDQIRYERADRDEYRGDGRRN